MKPQKFTIEHTIRNEYSNKRHVNAKIRTRIFFAENMLILNLFKDSPELNTIEIFKNLYMHTLYESFLSLQAYDDKTIKITSFQILFSNYA